MELKRKPPGSMEDMRGRASGLISGPEEALEILRSRPNVSELGKVLRYLSQAKGDFNIRYPSPKAALLVKAFIDNTVADHWRTLGNADFAEERSILLNCLTGLSGLLAVESRIRTSLDAARDASIGVRKSVLAHLEDLLDVLECLLQSPDHLWNIYSELAFANKAKIDLGLQWTELTRLLCGGRLLATAAEAAKFVEGHEKRAGQKYRFYEGAEYSRWIGRNIASLILHIRDDEPGRKASQILAKSFSLGYGDKVVGEICRDIILDDARHLRSLQRLLGFMTHHHQRYFLSGMLEFISRDLLDGDEAFFDGTNANTDRRGTAIGAAACLLGQLVENDTFKKTVIAWLQGTIGESVTDNASLRAAATTTLARDQGSINAVLERRLKEFGDKIYIQHAPILAQEANAQVVLLSAGCLHRLDPGALSNIARSSAYLNSVTNRLAASSPKSRLLGMIVGTAISALIDGPDKRMSFDTDEMDSVEAKWYLSLTTIKFEIGSLEGLKSRLLSGRGEVRLSRGRHQTNYSPRNQKKRPVVDAAPNSKILEVVDSDNDLDDGLVPYEKPDSDKEDEDEDPTIVRRDKPMPPVYIRDLIGGLRDSDDYDRHQLALSTAASLIRRKTAFGKEVTDHLEELATILTGLQDRYELENFQDMRLQAMVAVLSAQPATMGKWFAKAFFDGDYSMSQRAAVLSTLGLGAREISGHGDEDVATTGTRSDRKALFPSKMLPPKLHHTFAEQTAPVEALAQQLEATIIQPMAQEMAEKLGGPKVLKVQRVSSRIAVEKNRKKPAANELAKIAGNAFIFPLLGLWWAKRKALGGNNIYFSPFLLNVFLKTLSVIVYAAGPSAVALQQITSECWDFLLALRPHQLTDMTVLESLLVAFLTIIEVNEDKHRLATEHSRQLLETQDWARLIFENAHGGDEESARLKMLGAGALTKLKEMADKYQALLLGSA